MTDEDGNLKIIDLGLIHDINTNVFPNGTPTFISPLKFTMIQTSKIKDEAIILPEKRTYLAEFEIYSLAMSIIMIEYKIKERELIYNGYEILSKCFKRNNTYTEECFEIIFKVLWKNSYKDY